LASAQQVVKDIKEGYNSAIKNSQCKVAFLLKKIEELRSDKPNTDGLE
jgi:hypothetical protein